MVMEMQQCGDLKVQISMHRYDCRYSCKYTCLFTTKWLLGVLKSE